MLLRGQGNSPRNGIGLAGLPWLPSLPKRIRTPLDPQPLGHRGPNYPNMEYTVYSLCLFGTVILILGRCFVLGHLDTWGE